MGSFFKKPIVIIVFVIVAIGLGVFVFVGLGKAPQSLPVAAATLEPIHTVIGLSVEGRNVDAYTYGNGEVKLLFVGGIHGGYEWNSVILAYQFMDYLEANPKSLPDNLTVAIIPSANPDGVFKVIGKEGRFAISDVPISSDESPGRFNANGVDLNRNFDCKWQPKSLWKSKTVSAGSAPFSEPEAKALKDYILENNISAAIFWHSQSNAVYASQCENGILPTTLDIMNDYSKASGYPAVKTFDAYATTGAADDWLASIGISAITVELSTHKTIEWEKNLLGIKAIFDYYGQKVELDS
ncbi:MAG TPA: M14 family metallopeptidase [Candidatus Paceibacterota bacterium]